MLRLNVFGQFNRDVGISQLFNFVYSIVNIKKKTFTTYGVSKAYLTLLKFRLNLLYCVELFGHEDDDKCVENLQNVARELRFCFNRTTKQAGKSIGYGIIFKKPERAMNHNFSCHFDNAFH